MILVDFEFPQQGRIYSQSHTRLPPVFVVVVFFLPHLAPVSCFPALGTGFTFSRAWHRVHVFPCLALQVFPPLAPIACFPALGPSLASGLGTSLP